MCAPCVKVVCAERAINRQAFQHPNCAFCTNHCPIRAILLSITHNQSAKALP